MKLKWSLALLPPGFVLVAWVMVHFYFGYFLVETSPLLAFSALEIEDGMVELQIVIDFDTFGSLQGSNLEFSQRIKPYSERIPGPFDRTIPEPDVVETFIGEKPSFIVSTSPIFGLTCALPFWIFFLISITPVMTMWFRRTNRVRS